LLPTTTPVQFDPDALRVSVNKLADSRPDYMYLTHYGRVEDVPNLVAKMLEGIDIFTDIAEQYKNDDQRTQKIETAMGEWLREGLHKHGVSLTEDTCMEWLRSDIKLNTQGIEIWLDHRDR